MGAGKRSTEQVDKNAKELADKLAEASLEGSGDLIDLTDQNTKSIAGTAVTPLLGFAVRARELAKASRRSLDDGARGDPQRAREKSTGSPPWMRACRKAHDRDQRLRELGLTGLAGNLEPSHEEIYYLQGVVEGMAAAPPYEAFPAPSLLQRLTPPYMLRQRPAVRGLLEDDRENGNAGKARKPQFFEGISHWVAAKQRWTVAAPICWVIDMADAFNCMGNLMRVGNLDRARPFRAQPLA